MPTIIATRPSDTHFFEKAANSAFVPGLDGELEVLITRVNGCTRFEFENSCDGWMKKVYWIGIMLFLFLAILVATKTDGTIKQTEMSQSDIQARMMTTYFKNSSKLAVEIESDWAVQTPSNSESIATSESSGTESDEIGILILISFANDIDKRETLPKLLLMLILWAVLCPLIFAIKKKINIRHAYMKVNDILNSENQEKFCAMGKLLSVNPELTELCCYDLKKTSKPNESDTIVKVKQGLEKAKAKPLFQSTDDNESEHDNILQNSNTLRNRAFLEQEDTQTAQHPLPVRNGFGQHMQPPQVRFTNNPHLAQAIYYQHYNQGQMRMNSNGYYTPNGPQQPHTMHFVPHANQHLRYPQFQEMAQQDEKKELEEENPTDNEGEEEENDSDSESGETGSQGGNLSKHRSYGKRRKLNPGTGSVGAKFLTSS